MHFSVITPQPGREREAVHQMLRGPYREHQWLWRLFPSEPGTQRDHIYRRMDQGHVPRYCVVSAREPVADSDVWLIRSRPYQPSLAVGDVLEFELCANPVVTRSDGGKSRRHDVVMDAKKKLAQRAIGHDAYQLMHDACEAWLVKQGKHHGFVPHEGSLSVEGYAQHVVKDGKLRFSTVDFRGALTVEDPALFARMLGRGLGHAKAFGCGLMLVRRPI
ncbi:MAG: type I-E CRISPR-associated protein Cas6/Cse3/CasE [Aquabacterium sp.]|jgi:CRISPR system Cascade subunit CasE|uniref:type I-E CRISPR-associated protein Cas6/Cse3/CasE n=1 Tax=Aquabacterium sp. TaxID=1872578 RepID=UPI003BAFA5D3